MKPHDGSSREQNEQATLAEVLTEYLGLLDDMVMQHVRCGEVEARLHWLTGTSIAMPRPRTEGEPTQVVPDVHVDMPLPRVFISYAKPDREAAYRLAGDLERCDIQTFVDCASNSNVEAEFAAALAGEVRERRSFLFTVRLDDSVPEGLLEVRRYLDAFTGWGEVVAQLVDTWMRDRATGERVLPALHPSADTSGGTALYIHNRSLSVVHEVKAPAGCTGRELDRLVRAQLALPDQVTGFDGQIGVRFQYRLLLEGRPVSAHDTLVDAGIEDHALIGLEVRLDPFGPSGPLEGGSVVHGSDGTITTLAPSTVRALTRKAFAHLVPPPELHTAVSP